MSKISKQNSFKNYDSIRFKSSDFSEKSNNSFDFRKLQEPSFSNASSIKNIQQDQSSQFIYFQNDSALIKQHQSVELKKINKEKENSITNKSISFEDSLQYQKQRQKNNQSELIEYGTQQPNLPKTLKKPKFGFKVSQTAESSQIMNQVGQEYQLNHINKFHQNSSHQNSKILNEQSFRSNIATSKISSIRMPYKQPSLRSKQIYQNSLEKSDNIKQSGIKLQKYTNFGSVFKGRVEKASSLSLKSSKISNLSKKSLAFDKRIQNEVKIAQLQRLKELENKLGKLKKQNKLCVQYVIEKQKQIDELQRKRQQYQQNDPYAILKQNQLMRAFLVNKKEQKHQEKSKMMSRLTKSMNSIKSLKQLSIKKGQNKALAQYNVKQIKLKIDPEPLSRKDKNDIIANRAMILSNKMVDIGYSLKDNKITIYLTLKQDFQQVCIKLNQNSFIYTQSIDRIFKKIITGKQIKFKTQVLSTKPQKIQEYLKASSLDISIRFEYKFQTKLEQYHVKLPLTVYNIAKQISQTEDNRSSNSNQFFKTPLFASCNQLIKANKGEYLKKLFPLGQYIEDEQIFLTSLEWKQTNVNLKIKLKQRQFMIEGDGNPLKSSHELIKSIVNLLSPQKE